jgi:hypothetical protein
MAYIITSYTKEQAKKHGVVVKPSKNAKKKIDVFDKDGNKLASIGAAGMNDYPTYIRERGKKYADMRRKLYKQRHESDRHQKGSAGYWADKLLWSLIIIFNLTSII